MSVEFPKTGASRAEHEVVEETEYLPVFFSSPGHGGRTVFSGKCGCCTRLRVPVHWHEYVEILYILGAPMNATVQEEAYALEPGDMLIINSGELHSTSTDCRPNYLLMQISEKRLREIIPDFDLLHFTTCIRAAQMEKTPQLRGLFLEMKALFEAGEDGYQLLFTARLYEAFHILYKNYCCQKISLATDSAAGRDRKRITEIVTWTQQHYREPVTLDDAAGRLGISREYFCRIFKKYTGQTFLSFLCSTRTMHLYTQLLESDRSIPELMEANGLTNYKTFIRTFRDMYGTTPQKVRSGQITA